MMSTDQNHPPSDETPETALAKARALWAKTALGLAVIVNADVSDLVEAKRSRKSAEEPRADDSALLRNICSAVIAAQRTMELEDTYEQKVQRAAPVDAERIAREARQRLIEYGRAAGLRIAADGEVSRAVPGERAE